MKKAIEEYWQLALALFVIAVAILFMCCSCSSAKDVEHVYHHDTVYCNSVVCDSVDRWHTHYEFIKGDTLHMVDTFYRDRWHVTHDTSYKTVVDVQTRDVEKVVERKVYVWWPCWVALSIVAVSILYVVFRKYFAKQHK